MEWRRLLAVTFCTLSSLSFAWACACNAGDDATKLTAPASENASESARRAEANVAAQRRDADRAPAATAATAAPTRAAREVLYLPMRAQVGQALPTAIWLHGFRANPDLGAIGQALADQLGIAILGVSATESLGGDRYRWSEDPERDGARIREAIAQQASQLTIEGKPALFGFSQGGKMAAEIAAAAPDRYSGAWVIAPGGFAPPRFQPKGKLDGMVFRCSIGAGDRRGKVEWTRSYCEQAKAAGADTRTDVREGFDRHAFPPDFRGTFVGWAKRTLR